MNKISIRSTLIISILGVLALALLVVVENTKKEVNQNWYNEKLEAAQLAKQCAEHIKEEHFKNEIAIDNINDPNETGLIGEQFSQITSGRGSLPIKLSILNPNFAAMIVELLKEAGVAKGDNVAMCFTGSFPGLNIATSAAVQTIGANPILISSVTSSSWGGNNPDFTWLDMHNSLHKANLLSFMPIASSIGGNEDIGRTLSKEGRNMVLDAINRNGLTVLNEGSLENNIQKRMNYFEKAAGGDLKNIKLYINVGGGVASLGSPDNSNLFPSGLSTDIKLKDIPDKRGVIYEMASLGIPVLNLLHIQRLMPRYELPRDPVPLPEVGEGKLYKSLKYDLKIVIIALAVLITLIVVIIVNDKKQNKLGTQIVVKND